jgi:hypothetical protein
MEPDGDPAGDLNQRDQGLTEISLDARALLDAGITRVTLEASGQSQDLTLNQSTNTYDGALLLPAGSHSLRAQAYAGTQLVGASNPMNVEVQTGQVLRVLMRILDLRGSAPPVYGPILDAVVAPASTQATSPASFVSSIVAPGGDPVTYAWSSSCGDSGFSAPTSATTSWSKPTPGSCTISLVATSNGISIAHSFEIVVFPVGSASGAVDVSASFISSPTIYFSLSFGDQGCYIQPGSNASCPGAVSSPSAVFYSAGIGDWGGSTPGPITLSDSCGGRFGTTDVGPHSRSGSWLPPVGAGVCILTATAVSDDGVVGTASAAILVRAGTPATSQPPAITGQLYPGPICVLDSNVPSPSNCGAIPAGTQLSVYGNVSWADGLPGSVVLLDNCNGGLVSPTNANYFNSLWNLPSQPGQTCSLTVRATSLQGSTSETTVQYQLQ